MIERVALAAVILLALVWVDARAITGGIDTKDGALYERLAVDLARSGRFTTDGAPTREVEPLHVAAIALQVRLDPRLAEVRATGSVATVAERRALRQQNLVWGGLLLAGVAGQVLLLQQGRRARTTTAGVAVVAVTLLLLENPEVVDTNLAELPAAALVVWAGVLATRLVRAPAAPRAFALGALLGALALTRAVFAYVAVPYALILTLLWWWRMPPPPGTVAAARRIGTLLLAGLLGFGVVAAPWAVRNTLTFGDPGIAERGGEVLLIRTTKNTLDGYQLRGAVVHWAPTPAQPALARLLRVDLVDLAADRPLAVLLRDADDPRAREQSIYRTIQRTIEARTAELVAEGVEPTAARSLAEAETGERALEALRSDPLATLRTTPVFLWRFTWPMNVSTSVPRPLLALVNLAGMAALLLVAMGALVRRDVLRFAVVGLPAGATAFYALVTHALPRYARPLAPTMVLLLVIVGARLVERAAERASRSRRG